VGQCIELATCWTSSTPTPWSDTLSLAQLTSLGLGSTVPLVAAETSQYVMQLGITTMVFGTSTGPVTEMLPQFSGGGNSDPCNFCEIDIVGTFSIPANATGATISGFFGNTAAPNSAGMNVCLDSGAPCAAATGVPAFLLRFHANRDWVVGVDAKTASVCIPIAARNSR
jgi:hypothetical protein